MDLAICFRVCYFFLFTFAIFLSFLHLFILFLIFITCNLFHLFCTLSLSCLSFRWCSVWAWQHSCRLVVCISGRYFWLLCVSVDLNFRCHGTSTTKNATTFLSSIANTIFFPSLVFVYFPCLFGRPFPWQLNRQWRCRKSLYMLNNLVSCSAPVCIAMTHIEVFMCPGRITLSNFSFFLFLRYQTLRNLMSYIREGRARLKNWNIWITQDILVKCTYSIQTGSFGAITSNAMLFIWMPLVFSLFIGSVERWESLRKWNQHRQEQKPFDDAHTHTQKPNKWPTWDTNLR